ncbi:aspartate aminotransferase family protein [Loigolactobacillus backii]|uniref:aspartate aminotransferase family protein n=1 Tax=Loigolactobacillus backii TaxID=375175 RepID=UPI0007F0F52A|nr:aspartate aminotransferase family protein [Loigolactobacillus backii]ANK60413.1 4-aminobutyrate aminotransferase [Loigolactobacillus backii]
MTRQHQRDEQLVTQDQRYFAGAGRLPFFNLVVDHGLGAELWDVDGNHYIDLLASVSAVNVGHSRPEVVQAIKQQADQLVHYISGYFYHQPEIKLAERLAKLAPGTAPKKVSFSTSGSEAAEGLIKFARAYTKRPIILSFSNSWHGTTLGAATLSAISPNMHRKMGPLLPDVYHVHFPNAYRDQLPNETTAAFSKRSFYEFKQLFERDLPVEEVAAIIIEPIQGDAGIIAPPKAYLQSLANFCRQNGIMFAVDEINQGLGRSGTYWSIDHYGIVPDLLATGKSLASGMPLSAVIGRSEIMDSLPAPANATTTAANPICCAAALATLDVIDQEKLVTKSKIDGQYAADKWRALQQKYPLIGDVRCIGLNAGIELVTDRQTKQPAVNAAQTIIRDCFEHGVLMITGLDHILRFQPPLVITRAQLDQAFTVIDQAFKRY